MASDPFDLSLDDFALPEHVDAGLSLADFAPPKPRRPATLAALDEDGPNSSPPMDRPGDPDYVPGRLHLGNIDLSRRPTVRNADGSISTVRSISASFGHGEVLLPTVSDDGRILSNADAIDAYRKTGRHLGIFDSPDTATAYAQRLHQDQDRFYSGRRDMSQLGASLRAAGAPPATTPAPQDSPLYNMLGLDAARDTLAGAGRTVVDTVKAIPEELNRGTSGAEASLGALARASGQALDRAADRPVFAGPALPGAQQGILAPLYRGLASPLKGIGGEVEDIAGRQTAQADARLQGNPEADSIISRAVQGVPMLTGLAATGGGTAGATLGMGLLGAGGGLKQAEEAGATPGQAWGAAALQGGSDALLGQIGSVPAIRGLLHGVPVESAADAVLELAKQGGSGALQAIGMDVAHGLARKLTYAKDTGLDAGELAKNAAAQALLQGVLEAPGIEMAGREPAPSSEIQPQNLTASAKVDPAVAPFSGTWPDFLASRQMERSDYAVLTPGGKRAFRNEYEAATDAHREQAAAARAAAVPSRSGILAGDPGPLLDQPLLPSPLAASADRSTSGPLPDAEEANPADRLPEPLQPASGLKVGRPSADVSYHERPEGPVTLGPQMVTRFQKSADAPEFSAVRGGTFYEVGDGGFYSRETGGIGGTERFSGVVEPKNPLMVSAPHMTNAALRRLAPNAYMGILEARGEPVAMQALLEAHGVPTVDALRLVHDPEGAVAVVDRLATDAARRAGYDSIVNVLHDRPDELVMLHPDHKISDLVHESTRPAASAAPPPPVPPPIERTFASTVFDRLASNKPLFVPNSALERAVGQAAKGLWPTGLLRSPADVQILHDTLAGGGDLGAVVTALTEQAPRVQELPGGAAGETAPAEPVGRPGADLARFTESGGFRGRVDPLEQVPWTGESVVGDTLHQQPTASDPEFYTPAALPQAVADGRVDPRAAAEHLAERLATSRGVYDDASISGLADSLEAEFRRTAPHRVVSGSPGTVEEADATQQLAGPAAIVAGHLATTLPPEHVASFVPGDSGAVESPTNAAATRESLAGLPAVHPGSAEGVEGTQRWLLGSALGDQDLAHRLADSQDKRLSRLADPLASVAPSLAEAPPELRGYLRQAVEAYATTRESGETSPEISRLGRLLGADAPEEVHRIASFLSENAYHPESVALYLHRVAELHQQGGRATGGEGQLSLSQLLEMAADRDQRQAAGSVIPMESSNPVARSAITGKAGEEGFLDLRGTRFGEAAPIRRWFTRDGKFAAMGDDLATRTKDLVNAKDFRVKATSTKVVANVRDFGSALDDQMALLKHAQQPRPPATSASSQLPMPGRGMVAKLAAATGAPVIFDAQSTREDVLRYVRAGIEGDNDLSQITPALQEAAMALRAHLDAQSLAYATRPDLPSTLRQVIKDNVGTYLPRTFDSITDPKGWAKELRKDFRAAQETGAPQGESWRVSDAADWAQRQNRKMSREDAEGYAFKLLMDDPQAAYAVARGTQAQRAGMGSESRGNLKARLNLPEELDNLLGLHVDPSRSYQIGAMRAVRDLATYDLHSKVAAMGSADPSRADGLTPDGQRPIFVDRPTPDLPVQIGATGGTNGPLAGKYTSEQVAAAIRGLGNISPQHAGFMRLYLLANGAIKTGKIALNFPMGVARNMLTWPSLLLAGGHWVNAFPLKYAWETAKALPESIEANLGSREGGILKFAKTLAYSLPLANGETVGDHLFPRGQKLAELREEVYRLQEKGILGQSTSADDLRFYSGQTEEPTAGQKIQKVIRDLGGLWSGEHDLGKHIVFASEKANLRWANPDLPMDEIERMAADRTLATTPSRSEVSEGVRAIRAAPGVSPFPTFAAERFRNAKNNAMLAWEDLNSTNPRQKILGANRAAGLLAALTMAGGGASWMLQKLWNTGKEDSDALREFLAEYASTHQIAVADRVGGKIRYADISPQMPLTGVTDPAMAFLRGIHQGSTRDGMVDAAEEIARPFMDPEFALKAGMDIYRNQEFRGNPADALLDLAREHPKGIQERPVYLKGGPTGVVAGQIGRYLWHNAGPAAGLEAERFARANDLMSNTNSRGKRYTNQDEMAALGGVRFNTIDMNAAITSVGYDLKDALTESKRYFTGERSSSQNDPKTVLDARAAANDRWKNAFEIGMKKVAAARQLGIADYAIRRNLHISGVPPLVIGQLMAGRYSALPLRMPYRVPVDYAGAGAAPAGDE